ncbi:MAG: type IV toxin-antitoxin system AbiEi family antitoxin domain-containing protein [Planctomycetes bacterium]|nr:type IV toxin-antitoxin system AbiEi family antitoxin domain-containing protein [Planctomycetota bacterium]
MVRPKMEKGSRKPVETAHLTAKHAVTQEMQRRDTCRAGELAKDLGLKQATVANIMYGLYTQGYARRLGRGVYKLDHLPANVKPAKGKIDRRVIKRLTGPTMPAKIIALLQGAPDQALPFDQIRRSCGFSRQATGAVLSNLVKRGIVARPRRGFYRLRYIPGPYGDRAEIVERYLVERPWSRITEIQRGADHFVSADTVRKVLKKLRKSGKVKRDGFFYALTEEKRSAEECRVNREPVQPRKNRRRIGAVGRPPKTRKALLAVLRAYTRPRTVETLAKRVKLSVGAVRSVLSQLIDEGYVSAVKMRTDREDLRLVYHYHLIDRSKKVK